MLDVTLHDILTFVSARE